LHVMPLWALVVPIGTLHACTLFAVPEKGCVYVCVCACRKRAAQWWHVLCPTADRDAKRMRYMLFPLPV
jgi:hypothetical protein